MAETFKFELITPERMVMSDDAARVVVPGMEGEFTVLPSHAPVISALRPGIIDVALADQRVFRMFVKGGFAEVDAGSLTVLAQNALDVETLNQQTLASELQLAESELADAHDDAGRLAASAAMETLKALQK
jgi:F-type H+-transporting ATPase subunit epsilon